MKPVADPVLLQQLRWRYATKKFDPSRTIAAADWSTLEDSLVLTPSSFGLQPWKFIVVTNQALKEQLVPVSWGQRQVADASHLVVFAARKGVSASDVDRHLARTAEVRGIPVESLGGFRKVLTGFIGQPADKFNADDWCARQVYIALGNFMTTAALLGIDTCPMEGLEPAKYDEILGLNGAGYATVVACPAGYRAADDRNAALPKVRYANETVVEHRN
jgi:nitroreductase